ncbi:MAG: tetraacyldisaccharide 4'-kinase [Acidobacteria bacterium]|nr:tetraacyldisaccharide 4'-kinase [Acidobacteriota bacterium]
MLDLLYAQAVAARRRYYERHPQARRRLRQPVISVGNLSVGGTGKTPLVMAIAEWLRSRGERPAVLSRGYGRRDRRDGVVVVSNGERVMARCDEAGDEPVMIARAVPGVIVAVCEDRYLAGVVAERRLGATVHVLDDGFQHVQLARDLDLLMTSAGEIAGGRVLPFGTLREAASAAARADFVVVMDADVAAARAEAWTLGISQAAAARRVIPAASVSTPVFAICGLGKPQQFFSLLRDGGYQVAGTREFADHHLYTRRDLAGVADAARSCGATLVVTTTKDIVRLEPLEPWAMPVVAVAMTLDFQGWDQLAAVVDQALARAREAA